METKQTIRASFKNAIEVLKQDVNTNDYVCREHQGQFEESCARCQLTKKSRAQLIEDNFLYANQLF